MTRVLVLTLLLAACAEGASPPSLLPRAIESRGEAEAVAPTVAARPIDAALAKRIADLLVEARAGDAEFARVDGATPNLRAGLTTAAGSESWIAAQQARSALDTARQRSSAALAELDSLSVAQANDAATDAAIGGAAEIDAAKTEAEAIVARQTARIASLGG